MTGKRRKNENENVTQIVNGHLGGTVEGETKWGRCVGEDQTDGPSELSDTRRQRGDTACGREKRNKILTKKNSQQKA